MAHIKLKKTQQKKVIRQATIYFFKRNLFRAIIVGTLLWYGHPYYSAIDFSSWLTTKSSQEVETQKPSQPNLKYNFYDLLPKEKIDNSAIDK